MNTMATNEWLCKLHLTGWCSPSVVVSLTTKLNQREKWNHIPLVEWYILMKHSTNRAEVDKMRELRNHLSNSASLNRFKPLVIYINVGIHTEEAYSRIEQTIDL